MTQLTTTTEMKGMKRVYTFGDALVMTGFGKFNYLITFLHGLMTLSITMEVMGFGFIISASQCDLDLDITSKGILGAVPLVGLLSTSQIWGYISDTRGRRKIMIMSMILSSICSMLSSLSPNMTTMIIFRLLSSANMSAILAVIFAYFGEVTPKTHVDIMISVLSSLFIGSSIIGTAIAWGVLTLDFNIPISFLSITFRPWRLLLICYALPFLIAACGMYYAPESPKYLMSHNRKDEVLEILKKVYTMNTGKDSSNYLVDDILIDEQDNIKDTNEKKSIFRSVLSQILPLFKPPLILNSIIVFTLGMGAIWCVNPFFMWLPDLMDRFFVAVEHGNTDGKIFCDLMTVRSEIKSSLIVNKTMEAEICDDTFKPNSYPLIMTLNAFLTVVNITVAVLLRWVPKKVILLSLLILSCSSVTLLYFIKNYYVSWLLIILYQCCASTGGIINAYIVELFPTQYRAMASSFMLMFGRIGGIIGTNMFGWFLEYHCSTGFLFYGFLLLVCTLISFLLPNAAKKKQMVENPT